MPSFYCCHWNIIWHLNGWWRLQTEDTDHKSSLSLGKQGSLSLAGAALVWVSGFNCTYRKHESRGAKIITDTLLQAQCGGEALGKERLENEPPLHLPCSGSSCSSGLAQLPAPELHPATRGHSATHSNSTQLPLHHDRRVSGPNLCIGLGLGLRCWDEGCCWGWSVAPQHWV